MSYRTTTWQNVTITWYRQPEVEVYFFLTLLAFLSLLLIRDRWFSAPCKCDTYLVSSTRSRGFISVHCRHRGLFLPNPHFTFPVSDAPHDATPRRSRRRPRRRQRMRAASRDAAMPTPWGRTTRATTSRAECLTWLSGHWRVLLRMKVLQSIPSYM